MRKITFKLNTSKISRLIEPLSYVATAVFLFVCSGVLFHMSYTASLYPYAVVTQWLTFGLAIAVIPIGVAFLALSPILHWDKIKSKISERFGYKSPR